MAVLWKYGFAAASVLALSIAAAGPASAHMAAPAAPAAWMVTDQVAAEDVGPAIDDVDPFDPSAVIAVGNAVISPAS